MAVKTGVDILARAVDLTQAGVDSVLGRIRLLGREVKESNKASGELGAVFNAFKGGAAVAGITLLAGKLAESAEGAVRLRDELAQVDKPILEIGQGLLETVPVFGDIAGFGRRITESIWEFATGAEAAARASRRLGQEIQSSNDALFRSVEAANQLWELGDKRRIGLEEENRLLELILSTGIENEQAVRFIVGAEAEKKEILLRQGEELAKLEREREETLRRILQTAEDVEDTQRRFMEQTARLREDLQRQNEREIELLDRRQALERRLEGEKRAAEQQREAERQAQEQQREQEREAERQAREAERLAEQQAREQERRDEALRTAEDRLPGAKVTRALTGRAEAFLARRGEQGEAVAQHKKANALLGLMLEQLRKIADDPTEVIG